MHVLVTGASGLIGSALTLHLRGEGHEVTPLVRRAPGPGERQWDPRARRLAPSVLEGADAVVNLAGAGIGDSRWTDDYKRELRESRLLGTRVIAEAIRDAERPPSVLLSGSAVGYYGPTGDEELDEDSPAGTSFLAQLCVEWEATAMSAPTAQTRVALLRTGIVLSPTGGALKKQLRLFKLALGGRLGSGRQWQSWITLDDEVRAITHLLTSEVAGPVNLTAPTPVTNAEFTKHLGAALHRPAILPIPSFGPKLLLGGELTEALLMTGQRVIPRVLDADGFTFRHPTLEGALRSLLA